MLKTSEEFQSNQTSNSPSQSEDGTIENSKFERDPDFYLDDGNCLILVGKKTLFRVHKYLLERDDSFFHDLFKNARQRGPPSGDIPDNDIPFIELEDTPEQFRALCWASYALPTEIQAQLEASSETIDLTRLLYLAFICNKYHFINLETWSTALISKHIKSAATCSPDFLEKLVEIAVFINNTDLLDNVLENWLMRLEDELPVAQALGIGERFNLREFLGRIYYKHFLKMGTVTPDCTLNSRSLAVSYKPDFGPSPERIMRLYMGFYSLARLSGRFSEESIISCGSPHRACTNQLREMANTLDQGWKAESQCEIDLLGRARYFEDKYKATYHWRAGLCAECRSPFESHFLQFLDRLRISIPDHFLGVDA